MARATARDHRRISNNSQTLGGLQSQLKAIANYNVLGDTIYDTNQSSNIEQGGTSQP